MRTIILFFLFTFIGFGVFAQTTDKQIKNTADMLEVPFEALKRLVETFEPRNIENGIITIDAETLIMQFSYSETWAHNQYKGKTLYVEGTIIGFGLDRYGNYLSLGFMPQEGSPRRGSVEISFQDSYIDEANSLLTRTRISVTGTCMGIMSDGDIRIINAIINSK